MGINFSRLLTLKYGNSISNYLNTKYAVVSVGRVMTCVLGMVVRREREIREFVETPFYRVLGTLGEQGQSFEGEWRAVKGSRYFESFDLYKENGFKKKESAEALVSYLGEVKPMECVVAAIEKTHEERYRALLSNVEMQKVFEKAEETMWECRNCGHLVMGKKAPEVCPVCAHPQAYFEVRKENY